MSVVVACSLGDMVRNFSCVGLSFTKVANYSLAYYIGLYSTRLQMNGNVIMMLNAVETRNL